MNGRSDGTLNPGGVRYVLSETNNISHNFHDSFVNCPILTSLYLSCHVTEAVLLAMCHAYVGHVQIIRLIVTCPNRFGSAEIYNLMDVSFSDVIVDSLCIGQKYKDDERVVMFVKMAKDKTYARYYKDIHVYINKCLNNFTHGVFASNTS